MLRTLILAIGLAASLGALAQVLRTIPADAKRAHIQQVDGTLIQVRGRTMQLSVGAQVRDTSNRIIQPTSLTAGDLVKYTLNAEGYVHRVWILTLQEASQRDKVR